MNCVRCNEQVENTELQQQMTHKVCLNCIKDSNEWTNNGYITEKAMRLNLPNEEHND